MTSVVVAPATAPGRSALATVRLTGDGLSDVLDRVVRRLDGSPLRPGPPRRVLVSDEGGCFDDGVAWLRRGPGTLTGEDLCELSVHGNPLLVERLLSALVTAGARIAPPGEFTRRAVLAGRMDLVEAEAVDQVIRATGPEGLRVARAGMDGTLGHVLAELRALAIDALAELEARIDWPGDELLLKSDEAVRGALLESAERSRALASTFAAGRALVDGARVALVGVVNAGKSSLFNALLGRERALVHERPGTTRDVLEVRCRLGPLEVTLLDTAGERATDDPVEAMGQALAERLVGEADLLVVVLRAGRADPLSDRILERTAGRRRLVVLNGVDQAAPDPVAVGAIPVSAARGDGLPALRDAIVAELVGGAPSEGLFLASARQRDLLLAFAGHLEAAAQDWEAGPAVVADGVESAVAELDALTGADLREDVLDAIFARFCIGK
ncbi:MAG: tRNA modification GTPase [Alphaproteobacteria bacterium]|nr:tRNA modification GTPase [Alphaproteobacteria bacterium]